MFYVKNLLILIIYVSYIEIFALANVLLWLQIIIKKRLKIPMQSNPLFPLLTILMINVNNNQNKYTINYM